MANLYRVITGILFFVVIAYGKRCKNKDPLSKAQASTFKFSSKIADVIARQSGNHFVVSPFSTWNLLRVLSKGTGQKTTTIIADELQLPSRYCEKHLQYKKFLQSGNNTDNLDSGRLMVFDSSINIKDKFQEKVKDSGIDILNRSFEDTAEVADYINSKVKNSTHGLITSVVDPEGLKNKLLILIDFVYFKGEWKTPFLKSETQVQDFFDEERKPTGKVNMMFLHDKFKIKEDNEVQAKIVEIPYSSDRFSMLIILPNRNISIQSVLQSLKSVTPRRIFESGPKTTAMVQIPRFKMDFHVEDLKGVLSDVGLSGLFNSDADFSGITDQPLQVSGFSHKCALEVTEEGTVAAAVTEMEFEDRISPAAFTANRPFLFMIVENYKQVALFVGAYSKPSLF